ncbi:flagellar export protein FliJ [Planococcus salinarum]|uniref:flagellar export protein FliJ n=1 Tax=Planococcus salinarum TaxID=622695 RepID=UPI000E3D0549|nr:flagellar export protein FliJ [Planococcus salinarum]TAA72214.1 flagellar export protein FliJ [Planococcus salinarum]
MTQFNFRFQKILELKENEKGFAQVQMADAIKKEQAGHQKSRAITDKLVEAEQMKRKKQQGGINISELRMLEIYISQLQEQSSVTNRELEFLQGNVTRTQNQLQQKAQEEKTWGNLKEQELARFQEEKKVEEQNFFDELASARFYRVKQASTAERG